MGNNNANTDIYTDEFGSLPLNVTPGPIKRLLGCSVFTVDTDSITIKHNGAPQSISYADLREITGDGRQIKLHAISGQVICLQLASESSSLTHLLQRLKTESGLFGNFIKEIPSLGNCFGFFSQCLDFRARPYVMAADAILAAAAFYHFSDIHLEPLNGQIYRLSYRIAQEIKQAVEIARFHAERLLARLKYLAGCLSHVYDTPQEGAFKHKDFSVRLSTFPTDAGERASLRMINAARYPDISALGWEQSAIDMWRQQINENKGLFIISGPVGSGKTTAMYATLAELANQNRNLRVVSIEDPVEAKIDGICQSSLDSMKESSLASAFKHLLRQDPDVLALGEIRDSLCIREALQASLSGHLIFATFHAGSVNETIDRIRQMGVEDYLVMSGLRGILHLNLIRQGDKLKAVVKFNRLQNGIAEESGNGEHEFN